MKRKNTMKTKRTKTPEIDLGKWSAHDAGLLKQAAMSLGVRSRNSPTDDITVEMDYVDPSVQPSRPKKLGQAVPLRMEEADAALIKKLCQETTLTKARILRLSCHAGLRVVDWSQFKRQVGAKTKPVVSQSDLHPAVSLRILRHGVPEHLFLDRELADVMKSIETLSCFWALR